MYCGIDASHREIMNQDEKEYFVVQNKEGQYSIWPSEKQLPLGWDKEEVSGSKEECLKYIEQVWTDMRPISIREKE